VVGGAGVNFTNQWEIPFPLIDALVLAHYRPPDWSPTVITGDPEPAPWW
jgi:hypothetical protein